MADKSKQRAPSSAVPSASSASSKIGLTRKPQESGRMSLTTAQKTAQGGSASRGGRLSHTPLAPAHPSLSSSQPQKNTPLQSTPLQNQKVVVSSHGPKTAVNPSSQAKVEENSNPNSIYLTASSHLPSPSTSPSSSFPSPFHSSTAHKLDSTPVVSGKAEAAKEDEGDDSFLEDGEESNEKKSESDEVGDDTFLGRIHMGTNDTFLLDCDDRENSDEFDVKSFDEPPGTTASSPQSYQSSPLLSSSSFLPFLLLSPISFVFSFLPYFCLISHFQQFHLLNPLTSAILPFASWKIKSPV